MRVHLFCGAWPKFSWSRWKRGPQPRFMFLTYYFKGPRKAIWKDLDGKLALGGPYDGAFGKPLTAYETERAIVPDDVVDPSESFCYVMQRNGARLKRRNKC